MSRNVEQRTADILAAVDRCNAYVESLESPNPIVAQMAYDAIERNLQIIGEAVKSLPPQFTQLHPQVPWPQIVPKGRPPACRSAMRVLPRGCRRPCER